jgi:hypothetical protein
MTVLLRLHNSHDSDQPLNLHIPAACKDWKLAVILHQFALLLSFHKHSGRSQAQIFRRGVLLGKPYQDLSDAARRPRPTPCAHRSKAVPVRHVHSWCQRLRVHVLGADERGMPDRRQDLLLQCQIAMPDIRIPVQSPLFAPRRHIALHCTALRLTLPVPATSHPL